jgi:uncharacterized protein
MPFTMSQASLPVFEIVLDALTVLLDKAEAFATQKKCDPAVLLSWRIAPDMFTFARQVQIVSDQAKNGSARLAGIEPPRFEDTEKTIAELKGRIANTKTFLKTIDPKAIDGAAERDHDPARAGEQGPHERGRLPQPLRPAEPLLPHDRRLRDPARLRRRRRQNGLSGQDPDDAQLTALPASS